MNQVEFSALFGPRDPRVPIVFLAPMEGITAPAFREYCVQRGGLSAVCTEFVRVTASPFSARQLKRHVVRPSSGLLSVQVMGRDLIQLGEATQMVTAAGADIVDLNLGCPSPAVVRKGVGAAMLKDLVLLRDVVCAMRARTHLPLSAKMRAGFDDQIRAVDIARTLEDSGVDFITVHPRKRSDFYRGRADWSVISSIAESVAVPVIANGDIWTTEDAAQVARQTKCAALMLGRPLLRNPWLAADIRRLAQGEPVPQRTTADLLHAFQSLMATLVDTVPPHALTGVLKEHLRYLLELDSAALGYARDLFRETLALRLEQGVAAACLPERPLLSGAARQGGLFEQRNEPESPSLPIAQGGCSSAAPT